MSTGKTAVVIDRRSFLGRFGAGASAGLLSPLFPLMDSEVGAAGYPLRFVVFCNNQGNCDAPSWRPSGSGSGFVLSDVLSPLQPFRDRLTIIEGLGYRAADILAKADGVKFGHFAGTMLSLTGASAGPSGPNTPAGISVDQKIAAAIKGNTPFPVLSLGTQPQTPISFVGPHRPFPVMPVPADTFATLFPPSFKPPASDPAAAQKALQAVRDRRRRVLDHVTGDAAMARNLVGAEGWAKIDHYRTAVEAATKSLEDLDNRLATGTCAKPQLDLSKLGANYPAKDPMLYIPAGEANQRLAAAALACDLTRVVVLQWGGGGGGGAVPEAGVAADSYSRYGYHTVGHYGYNVNTNYDPNKDAELKQINYFKIKRALMKFYAKQLATFLGYLQATREGAGTLLDNTLVLWTNSMGVAYHKHFPDAPGSQAAGHSHLDAFIPNVLVVGRNVPMKAVGQYLKFPRIEQNGLLASLCQAMGLGDVTAFGDATYGNGPLPGLV